MNTNVTVSGTLAAGGGAFRIKARAGGQVKAARRQRSALIV